VAQLVGTPRINLVKTNREDGTLYVADSAIHLPIPEGSDLPPSFSLGVRPEDVKPDKEGDFPGQITLIEPLGVETILHIKSGEQTLLSLIPGLTDLRMGDEVRFNIVRERLHCFQEDGTRISV
jgi:multiple sugar transport system ATP-binding protein